MFKKNLPGISKQTHIPIYPRTSYLISSKSSNNISKYGCIQAGFEGYHQSSAEALGWTRATSAG
jgi:hypothetical protein